jgi:SAM-dependent methyltransferase
MKSGTMHINGVPVVNAPIFRRIIQTTCDLARGPLTGLRILDLACAHGDYSIELATRGASVVGIEGREEWLRHARARKAEFSLSNVEFVQDDVRNLSKEKYGEFDIVLCLGILYHLDAPDVFELMGKVAEVCRNFAILETHFATASTGSQEWRGKRYSGHPAFEHAAGASQPEKLKALGASLDNESSFWMTRPSLCNLLRHVGFTTVADVRNPVAHLLVGEDMQFKIWGNRVTLAAVKGQPVNLSVMPDATMGTEVDWPEDIEPYLFERVVNSLGKTTG